MNDDDIEPLFRLIANPLKIKRVKQNYKENEYLKMYLNNKYKIDIKTLNFLTGYVDNFIETIDIDKIIIKSVVEEIIDKLYIENR
tara:strand:+ start:136 stop:390 length:255 start_codon:yes stop_codon:yes gene_type:complete